MFRMNGRASPGSTVVKTLEQEADECYQSILLPINERMMGPLPQVSYGNTYHLRTWCNEIYYTERSLLVILK